MKKLIALAFVLVLSFFCSSCGYESVPADTAAVDSSTASQKVSAEESEMDTITMPESFFGDMTEEEIKAAAEEKGYISCTVNEDGSVTYTMSREKHEEMLETLEETIDDSLEELISGENAFGSYRKIEHNENCTEFRLYVDYEAYQDSWDAFGVLAIYVYGSYYQACEGIGSEDIDFTVQLIDDSTGEVVGSSTYQQWMMQYSEMDTAAEE